MGFEFRRRRAVEICGKQYEIDLADLGFIEAVVVDFAAIIREYETLEGLHREMGAAGTVRSAGQMAELSGRLAESNRRVFDSGLQFVATVLGEEARDEIFAGRRANSVEAVELCAYLYQAAIESREGVVSQYVLPNCDKRRAAAKKSGSGRKKLAD